MSRERELDLQYRVMDDAVRIIALLEAMPETKTGMIFLTEWRGA